jgi:hypothetical protein
LKGPLRSPGRNDYPKARFQYIQPGFALSRWQLRFCTNASLQIRRFAAIAADFAVSKSHANYFTPGAENGMSVKDQRR